MTSRVICFWSSTVYFLHFKLWYLFAYAGERSSRSFSLAYGDHDVVIMRWSKFMEKLDRKICYGTRFYLSLWIWRAMRYFTQFLYGVLTYPGHETFLITIYTGLTDILKRKFWIFRFLYSHKFRPFPKSHHHVGTTWIPYSLFPWIFHIPSSLP